MTRSRVTADGDDLLRNGRSGGVKGPGKGGYKGGKPGQPLQGGDGSELFGSGGGGGMFGGGGGGYEGAGLLWLCVCVVVVASSCCVALQWLSQSVTVLTYSGRRESFDVDCRTDQRRVWLVVVAAAHRTQLQSVDTSR